MDRDANSALQALHKVQEQLRGVKLILVDFTFLLHMHGKELLEWLTSFATSERCKVLVCDEFFCSYGLFQKSESPQQREIAAGANNFINMLSRNHALVQDERFETMEQLILKLQTQSNIALFLAQNSEADEVVRSCKCSHMTVVSYMSDGSLFCGAAVDYLNEVQQVVSRSGNELAMVYVPDFPELNDVVHTKDKTEYVLTGKLSSGAEGTIYLTSDQSYVCKIYHPNHLTLEKIKKLGLLENRQVHYEGICWPEARVFTAEGYPVGFLMKKASGQRLSSVFDGEEAVGEAFPNATRKDLVGIAISVFEKIQYLHLMGILIGDIRPQNILIDNNRNVYLTDLDSCQIGGYPSVVGDEDYTPAENQGRAFSGFLRTYRNERFSCAVLLFYILFLGQHPYAQRNGADTIGEEIATRSFRYPKDKKGDYSLIPYGCYANIWKFTPLILSDAFYDVFRNDIRLSVYKWLQLMYEYYTFLKSLPLSDIRTHLSCASGALSLPASPPTPSLQERPFSDKKIARQKKKKIIMTFLLLLLLASIICLVVYIIFALKLDTTPKITELFTIVTDSIKYYFQILTGGHNNVN